MVVMASYQAAGKQNGVLFVSVGENILSNNPQLFIIYICEQRHIKEGVCPGQTLWERVGVEHWKGEGAESMGWWGVLPTPGT